MTKSFSLDMGCVQVIPDMELLERQLKQRATHLGSENEATLRRMVSTGILPYLRLHLQSSPSSEIVNENQAARWSISSVTVNSQCPKKV